MVMLPTRDLLTSVDGSREVDAMLFRSVSILAGSAGMTLCTCFTVFKRENVKRDAGHGTMFMVFLCWFVWSVASLWRTLLVFFNDKLDSLESMPIRHITFITEVFFNAISLWFVAAAYEFQRRALTPRTPKSHNNALVAYMAIIGGVTFITLVALVALDRTGAVVQGYDEEDATEAEPLSAIVLARMSWGSWALRCIAVVYPAVVAVWLHIRRNHLQTEVLPRAMCLIAVFFFVLNTPYLVIDPLFVLEILHPTTHLRLLGLMKSVSYASGLAISFVMGLTVRSFDSFYSIKGPTYISARMASMFVLSDNSV